MPLIDNIVLKMSDHYVWRNKMHEISSVSKRDVQRIAKEFPQEVQNIDFGDRRFLCRDIGFQIFTLAVTHLDTMALVCKSWAALADDRSFLYMLREHTPQISGEKEWRERFKMIKIDPEIRIPRDAYRKIAEGAWLTFIPQEVTLLNENKQEEVIPLDSLAAIERLFTGCIGDIPRCFTCYSDKNIILEKTALRKSHWVCISTKVVGYNKSFEQQQSYAVEEYGKAYAADSFARLNFGKISKENPKQIIHMARPIDLVVSAIFSYLKMGNSAWLQLGIYGCDNLLRVPREGNKDSPSFRIGLNSDGIFVSDDVGSARPFVGFVCACSSFEPNVSLDQI